MYGINNSLKLSICLSVEMPHPKTTYRSRGEVIVDDKVDALEVNAASHELGADEHPDAAGAECAHRVLSLLLRPACTSINLSVGDPDPDLNVFGPPGSVSISQRYGSGSGSFLNSFFS
jgi:hypothetical protein